MTRPGRAWIETVPIPVPGREPFPLRCRVWKAHGRPYVTSISQLNHAQARRETPYHPLTIWEFVTRHLVDLGLYDPSWP